MSAKGRIFIVFLVVVACFHFTGCNSEKEIFVNSPSENLEAIVSETETGLNLELWEKDELLLNVDLAKFILVNDSLPAGVTIIKHEVFSKDTTWQPVYGERNLIRDRYNGVRISLRGEGGEDLSLECRLYDEGIAFRHLFVEDSYRNKQLKEELTTFHFDQDYDTWITGKWGKENRAQASYLKIKMSQMADNLGERPQVVRRDDTSYLALGEAALVDFARMRFMKSPNDVFALQTKLDGPVDLQTAGYATPWRYVMVGDSPGQLLENNYFVLNLNEPGKLEDSSWIKPGKVIREITLTTKGGLACVDFAAEHNLQYVEFDAGWYGHEYSDESDATTITVDPDRSAGPLDLHRVINYANDKGVGIVLYVNRRQLETQLDELLPLYKSWGVKGMKYGFVQVGSQEWTVWLHEAVRKAAEHQLMVDIHDEYRGTGYSRTYPNLMTMEGIKGDEETPSTEHSLITLFTRMLGSAGDNTICYYAPRVYEKMGGKAAQMAKSIMLYSPWQFLYWYDRPQGSSAQTGGSGGVIPKNGKIADLSFFDALPTSWDAIKVLEGQIGAFATIARKSGRDWFVGSLTAKESRTVVIPLSFLDKDEKYEATIYSQDEEGLKDNTVDIEKMEVNAQTVITKFVKAEAGIAMVIKKQLD